MLEFFGKLLGPQTTSDGTLNNLEDILKTGNNFDVVPADAQTPEHVIAHGLNIGIEPHVEIRTAINIKNDIEFSTVIGQIPNTSFGMALTDSLNHVLGGKFITFDSTEKDKRDVVYATAISPELATQPAISQELENHARTQVLISPLLSSSQDYAQPSVEMDNQTVIDLARQLVDVTLNIQNKLIDSQTNQYLPIPKST